MLILAIGLALGFILGALEGRRLGSDALAEIHAIRTDITARIADLETSLKGKL